MPRAITDGKPVFGDETAEALYEAGYEPLAEFVDGPVRITELEVTDFLAPLGDGWALRAFNDESEIHYARGVNGKLIQIRDADRDGDFGRPFECWEDEFGDYVLSGNYVLEYIDAAKSAFEVADSDE